jgi:hypothetical protein
MSHQTDLRTNHFIEGSTPQIRYVLKDEDGVTITTALTTQEASIYDVASGLAVGTWTDKDIDGAEGNLVTSGSGVWDLPASATAKVGDSEFEDHIIAMKFTYGTGRVGKHFILVKVMKQVVGG